MIRALHISATGLQHQQRRLYASAHNTANATTGEAEAARLRTSGRHRGDGGVASQTYLASSTDAVREAVVQIDSAKAFAAGVRAVQTQDDMLGALLDIEA